MTQEPAPKLCVTCKHCFHEPSKIYTELCNLERSRLYYDVPSAFTCCKIASTNVVNGVLEFACCSTARLVEYCGPEGKWWEPRNV